MRKILSTLMLLFTVAFLSKGQDIKPIDPINFKALQSPSWSYMTLDSAIWIYKGSTYGWTKIHGDTHLKRYYVPYDNALRNVNLGDKKITSTKQRLPLFNGACVVPTITDNGNGSITVSNGEYHLSTNTEGRGTENFLINGGTFALIDQTQNYLVADYNSGTPILKVITDVNLINETTVIPIYTAYRNGIFLHFQNWDALGLALANKVHQSIVKTQRYRREYGLIVTEYGTHNLNMTAGRVWVGAVPVDIAEINTGIDNLSIWYHSGGNWVNSIQPTYNFTQWDNGTNLVTLTNNRYAVNWIFRGIENQKHLYIVLGRGDYSLVEAEASSMPPIPTAISSHATLVAKLIVEKNAATATNIKSAFEVQFSLASVQKHDDLTGRDVVNSHPASAVSNTPAGNISSTNVQAAINELDAEKEPLLTKGLLTETVDGLELSSGGTRQVIGGSEAITLTAGRVIPTTTNISHAETAYTHSQSDTDLSPTNEIQTLSTNGSAGNISISSGNTITLNVNDHINRTALDNVSGVNTGDQTLSSLGGQPQLNGTGFVKASGTTISYDNSTYEPAFSKNTAFNKNFGTTTGTVLEGRTFGTAANNNTGDFIFASPSSAQSASIWVNGSITSSSDGETFRSVNATNSPYSMRFKNNGGDIYFGVENSDGSYFLANPFEGVIYSDNSIYIKPSIRVRDNVIAGAGFGFQNATYITGSINPIWSFATAINFGIGYSQDDLNGDDIRFYFGDKLNPKFKFMNDGSLHAANYKIDSTPLLLDWLKSGSAPTTTQVLVGGGTTSSPVGITGTEGQVLKIVSGVPQFAASSGGLSVTPYLATSNSNYTLDLNTYINSRSSTNTNITITLSNLDDGETGNIEVTYTGAAVVTFVVDSSYTINMADNIWNTTTTAYIKSVTVMSSGTATYSYYRSGNNVKIHGTQYYQ